MASSNPNQLKNVLPGAGTSFAVNGSTEIFTGSVDTACLAANAITAAKLGANSVLSASVATNLLQYVRVTLTPAQIKTLYSAPTLLIAAPDTGLAIVVQQAHYRFTYTTPQYTSGGVVVVQYANTVHGAGVTVLTTIPAASIQAAASEDGVLQTIATTTAIPTATALYASAQTADFATGTVSTLKLDIWYEIL